MVYYNPNMGISLPHLTLAITKAVAFFAAVYIPTMIAMAVWYG